MRKIAVFDVCFTLFDCNTTASFFSFLKDGHLTRFILFFLFQKACSILHVFEFFNKYRACFLTWLNSKIVFDTTELYYESFLKKHQNAWIMQILQDLHSHWFEIYLVSASLSPVISKVAEKLWISTFFATTLEEKDWKFTGRIIWDLLENNAKKKILIEKINADLSVDFNESYAYSDSIGDLNQWNAIKNRYLVTKDVCVLYVE